MTSVYELTSGRHGRFFVNKNDTTIGKSLLRYGEWSDQEIRLFAQMVRLGDVVAEPGANIGSHTVWFSKSVGDSGKVIALEPARHTFQLLCANLVANDCLNVTALQQAMGEVPGFVDFNLLDPRKPWNFGGASLMRKWSEETERVQVATLDGLELPRLDFLKADVEGFELNVLRGGMETIQRDMPVIYIEINSAGIRDDAIALLAPLGYDCWYYITPMFNTDNWKAQAEDVLGDWSLDMLCLPKKGWKVEGMAQAAIDDNVVTYTPAGIQWLTPWWSEAKVARI